MGFICLECLGTVFPGGGDLNLDSSQIDFTWAQKAGSGKQFKSLGLLNRGPSSKQPGMLGRTDLGAGLTWAPGVAPGPR